MNPVVKAEIEHIIEKENYEALDQFCSESHPVVVAESLCDLDPQTIYFVLSRQTPEIQAAIFCNMDTEHQLDVSELMTRKQLASLVTNMDPDDRVDFLKNLPEEKVDRILPVLAQAEREDIRRLYAYEEGTAGSVMTTEYVTLKATWTVKEATQRIRLEAPDKESIYYSYIIDDQRRLLGFISLKNIIMSNPKSLLEEVMNDNAVSIHANEDREEAAKLISRYDLLAIPVVDADDRMVGIITHDDAVDIIVEEHSDDLDMIGGLTNVDNDVNYLSSSVFSNFKSRVLWLVLMVLMGVITSAIIQGFEASLSTMMVLTLYIPMLGGTGGNSGSQASTVVIRAIGAGSLRFKDILKVIWKEFRVSILLAAVLGLLAFLRVLFFSGTPLLPQGISISLVAITIALALSVQVITATILGAVLPLIVSCFKIDPAVVASPALSSMVDITGLLIYFGLAKLLLGI